MVGEELGFLYGARLVADGDLPHFLVASGRHEEEHLHLESVLRARDARVAHAVAALVGVELGLDGHPSGVPDGTAVVDVDIAAAEVVGNVVVAVAR